MGYELIFEIPSTYVDTLQSIAVGRQLHPGVLGSTFFAICTEMAHTRASDSKTYPTLKYTYLHSQTELGGKLDI